MCSLFDCCLPRFHRSNREPLSPISVGQRFRKRTSFEPSAAAFPLSVIPRKLSTIRAVTIDSVPHSESKKVPMAQMMPSCSEEIFSEIDQHLRAICLRQRSCLMPLQTEVDMRRARFFVYDPERRRSIF